MLSVIPLIEVVDPSPLDITYEKRRRGPGIDVRKGEVADIPSEQEQKERLDKLMHSEPKRPSKISKKPSKQEQQMERTAANKLRRQKRLAEYEEKLGVNEFNRIIEQFQTANASQFVLHKKYGIGKVVRKSKKAISVLYAPHKTISHGVYDFLDKGVAFLPKDFTPERDRWNF